MVAAALVLSPLKPVSPANPQTPPNADSGGKNSGAQIDPSDVERRSSFLYYWRPAKTNYYLENNVWTTVAGSAGIAGSADGSNDLARFDQPVGLAMNKTGDIYIADAFNHTIRKMSRQSERWSVATIAGAPGLSGSADGTSSAARFNQPTGIALDEAGDIFVADTLNNTIRKITPIGNSWMVTTIAGLPGTNGFRDGTNQIARFNRPLGVAADKAGNLYVADAFNHTIRKITMIGTNSVVRTIAGSPLQPGKNDGVRFAARFNQPTGVTVDNKGDVYVADKFNCTIRRLHEAGTNWIVTTIAGVARASGFDNGVGVWARFDNPCAISIDAGNNLFVTDSSNYNIRKISPYGTNWIVSTLGGWARAGGTNDGVGTDSRFYCPCGIAVDPKGTDFYVADSMNHTVRAGKDSCLVPKITPGEWILRGVEGSVGRKPSQ